MPKVRIDNTLEMHYELDDYTDPWTTPETILLVHGVADTSKAWFAWVPQLARRFRVLRPDLRGFGQSSIPSRDYQWSLGGFAKDLKDLLDHLHINAVHVVGQRIGGSVTMQFAHDFPDRVKSLVVIGGPATLAQSALKPSSWLEQVQREGVESWARTTMGARLGEVSPAMREWWIKEMGKTAQSVMEGIFRYVSTMDITAILPQIKAPTLVITSDRGALAAVETVRSWQTRIPNSRLLVLPSSAYHLAAAMPEECAQATVKFIESLKS
jgi:3-oxoadipate enol-lactonase